MWVTMDARFREERKKFNLKESCEDCRHFCLERKRCAVIYPVDPHLKASFENASDGDRIFFCKMFEVDDA